MSEKLLEEEVNKVETTESNESTEASRPVEASSIVVPYEGEQRVLFGRTIIYSSLTKKELTAQNILKILPQVLKEHDKNAQEIDYLYRFYKGHQPILYKTKAVRPDINNIVLENHAFEIVEFKKSSEFGEPVQYVQKGEKNIEEISKEISLLNRYMESEDKSSLDNELAEWQYICGTAYRWCDVDKKDDEDEAPFEISVPDPRRTFVVYSNGIKKEPLFSGFYSYFSDNVITEDGATYLNKSRIITIYTDDNMFQFKDGITSGVEIIKQEVPLGEKVIEDEKYPLLIKGQRIIEYPLNQARLGYIELVITQLNALNKIKSDDLDAIDQFVQSLIVFINQEVDPDKFVQLSKLGAVEVNSQAPDKPADVKLLVQQLLHSETKIVTDDIYEKMLTILGMPKNSQKASGGDTGQARSLGEGWELSYQRAKQDDLAFTKSERRLLKLVLSICKADTRKTDEKIKTLKISDVDIKIPRNKADNLLVKAQALLNLLQAGVHPEVAFSVVGLFGDPHDVYVKSLQFQGEDFWKKVSEIADEKLSKINKNQNQEKNKITLSSEGNS